jgi:predicted nucleic acid-binding Zn ribbon protein
VPEPAGSDPPGRDPSSRDPAAALLARLRGQAGRRGAQPDRHGPRTPVTNGPAEEEPERFGAAIDRLVGERGWDETVTVATVMGRWDHLVGPELAAHCRPERLSDGELVLVAESTAWATQIRLLTTTVLARLGAELGDRVVRTVKVHGPAGPDWRYGRRRVTGSRGPRDTYG